MSKFLNIIPFISMNTKSHHIKINTVESFYFGVERRSRALKNDWFFCKSIFDGNNSNKKEYTIVTKFVGM